MKSEYTIKSMCCIVKSPDGRPSVVFIDEIEDDMVSIKPEPGRYDRALFIPMTQAFADDEILFSQLKSAYESRNRRALDRLWKKALPLKETG